MGLKQVQEVLAQLYTNAELRKSFLQNPEQTGSKFGLKAADVEQLRKISLEQIEIFARSLQQKRLAAVKKLLPLSYQKLGENFSTLFLRHAELYIPEGIKKHLLDAIAFAKFIQSVDSLELWLKEFVCYEAAWLEMNYLKKKWAFCFFCNRIDKLLVNSENIQQQKVLILWFRLPSCKLYSFAIPIAKKQKNTQIASENQEIKPQRTQRNNKKS